MRTLVFDFDGTLVDSFRLAVDSVNKLSKKYHFSKFEKADNWKQKSLRKIIKEDLNLNSFILPLFLRDLKKLMLKESLNLQFFKKLIPVLRKLSNYYDLGILTSNSKDIVQTLLEENNANFFKFIYSESSLFGKHIILKKIIKKYSLNSSNVVYVGDEPRDVEAAKKLNIKVIAVSWGFNSREVLETAKPNFIVNSPTELYKLLTSSLK